MKQIDIALVSDNNFSIGLIVTFHSICRYARVDCHLVFHIIDLGLEDGDCLILKDLAASFTNKKVDIIFHKITSETMRQFPEYRGNRATCARLLLQNILDVTWVVYSDVDMLWFRDIAELYNLRDEKHVLFAAPDGSGFDDLSGGKAQGLLFGKYGKHIKPREYFNAGLMLLNLKYLRESDFDQKCRDFFSKKDLCAVPDQNAYNFIYPVPATQLIDPLWGEFANALGRRTMKSPRVIHLAYSSPWVKNRMMPAQLIWWHYVYHIIGLDNMGKHGNVLSKECQAALCFMQTLQNPASFWTKYGWARLFNQKLWWKRCVERNVIRKAFESEWI